jgi:hypothetical protein
MRNSRRTIPYKYNPNPSSLPAECIAWKYKCYKLGFIGEWIKLETELAIPLILDLLMLTSPQLSPLLSFFHLPFESKLMPQCRAGKSLYQKQGVCTQKQPFVRVTVAQQVRYTVVFLEIKMGLCKLVFHMFFCMFLCSQFRINITQFKILRYVIVVGTTSSSAEVIPRPRACSADLLGIRGA